MTVREATAADHPAVLALFEAMDWDRPWPRPPVGPDHLEGKLVLVAEEDGEVVGFVFGEPAHHGRAHVNVACVRRESRRQGVMTALLKEFAARARAAGSEHLTLDVDTSNEVGRAVWERLGFAKVLPWIGGSDPEVREPAHGWTALRADVLNRDRKALERLASEVSNATAAVVCTLALEDGHVVRYALYERGSIVDEYQSVPEYYGPVPPGDVVALGANPRVVSRLTGADPARVRAVARTASSPDDLPPAPELLQQIADLMGLPG